MLGEKANEFNYVNNDNINENCQIIMAVVVVT
ncbi:hypothetical protein Metev_0176 [Methanohalobium evestigatum Z-7303]|uniref:Uncharacterized protein n=1 Tax=Methanohalobium evestigatum (strain ATCC BAA-1072 / DSM 3721 / NBRC 107634 / OCM 161 / Z-7303) TaxID=644295 RepID=D7E685_METEZ|nr:hypothetical protein Metev_0176 [Methanohalobium evestigatum Z-7303]